MRARLEDASPRVAAGLLAVAVLVLRLPSLFIQLFIQDEAALSAQGLGLAKGGTMYLDAIDRKPPLVPFLYEWSHRLTGDTDLRPMHVVAGVLLGVAAAAFASEGRRVGGARAMWWTGGLLVTGALAMVPADAQAANYSHIALPFGALALVASRRNSDRAAFAAGLFLALATLSRQTWAIGVIPATVAIVMQGPWRRRLPIAFVGGLIPVGMVALVVPWADFVYGGFRSNGSFVFEGATLWGIVGRAVGSVAVFGAFHLVAWVLCLRAGVRRDEIDLWLWLATGVVAMAVGFRFGGHYWLQALRCSRCSGAPGGPRPLACSGRGGGRRRDGSRRARAGVVPDRGDDAAGSGTAGGRRRRPVGSRRQRPDLGQLPRGVLDRRAAPCRGFVSMDFLTGRSAQRSSAASTVAAPGRAYPHLLDSIRADRPAVVIDMQPTGHREYAPYSMTLFPELAAFVEAHYGPRWRSTARSCTSAWTASDTALAPRPCGA
ncbi:MAG: glycosyltransferase family 39 protein [Acidimicrobiales bacterium]